MLNTDYLFLQLNSLDAVEVHRFFELQGFRVISLEPTKSGFTSRCMKVTLLPQSSESNPQKIVLHLKWMGRSAKANKSKYEPIASKILRGAGIETPEVLAYIPE